METNKYVSNEIADEGKTTGFSKVIKKIPSDKIVLSLAIVFIFILFASLNPNYASTTNIINIFVAASLTGLVAIGATYLIIAGMNDLSPGSVVAFTSVLSAVLSTNFKLNFGLVLLITIIAGGLVGIFNAFMVNKIQLDPFIATLVTQSIFRGVAYIICEGKPVPVNNATFNAFGTMRIFNVPIPVIILVICLILFGLILSKTVFGRSIYVIGGSKDAARLAGLNPQRIVLICYILMGIFCAIGGITLSGRMSSGQPAASVGLEFDAITAVILGGVSFSGGVGDMFGTVLGVLILQSFNTGLIMTGVPTFWQFVARGLLLLLALTFDFFRKKKREKGLIEASKKNL
ncbi:ABC transporter permease [Enterococcus rivorum]|uniref:ABC transporter permease n=1 Tax=Enterococcus rivorum TaxID=762845 RepID=UPI000A023A2D|nr:ABC transporter permease [Enterococcus rivorum]MBP2097525.1 ribose/xylose/arabinose/galactoside ABC-type transport system permease subunit [Enterococcus rivorum]